MAFWCITITVVITLAGICRCDSRNGSKLLLVLANGIRHDFPDEDKSYSGFFYMSENGVRSMFVEPVFPTLSYPNWRTLVTGLYPENHGFVHDIPYDPDYRSTFSPAHKLPTLTPFWWNKAEPIWVTAEKEGIRTALYWWDGCTVEINGWKPSFCKGYQETSINNTKAALETILSLFENDEIDMVLLNHDPVFREGRDHGPDSQKRKQAMKELDSLLSWLQAEMINRTMFEQINLIVLSDHGMTAPKINNTDIIVFNKTVLDVSDVVKSQNIGSYMTIYPVEGKLENIYQSLKKVKGIDVFKKDQIPDRYHIKSSRRCPPLVLVPERGYWIQGFGVEKDYDNIGSSGYDPIEVPDMNGIYLAKGPCFKTGLVTEPLSMVDIYNIMCNIINIEPLPNNGSHWRINPMLNPLCVRS